MRRLQEDRESDCAAMRIIGLKQKGGFATHCLVEHDKFLVDIEGLMQLMLYHMLVLELRFLMPLKKWGLSVLMNGSPSWAAVDWA